MLTQIYLTKAWLSCCCQLEYGWNGIEVRIPHNILLYLKQFLHFKNQQQNKMFSENIASHFFALHFIACFSCNETFIQQDRKLNSLSKLSIAKACSPVLRFSMDMPLLHFQEKILPLLRKCKNAITCLRIHGILYLH